MPRSNTTMARAKGLSRRSKILPFTSHIYFTDVAGLFFLLLVSSAAQGKHLANMYTAYTCYFAYLASRVGKELVWPYAG